MRRDEFLKELARELEGLTAEQVAEAVSFHAEAIDDRIEAGMPEEEAVAAMGSPREAAAGVLDGLPPVPRAIARTRRLGTVVPWVLAIIGSPIWIGFGLAFLGVALGVYVSIWALALAVWALAGACLAGALVSLLLAACGVAIGHAPFVLAMAGSGLACAGAALLVGFGAWKASALIVRLSLRWVRWVLSPFIGKRPLGGRGRRPRAGGGPGAGVATALGIGR